jgi:hypothetical protein
MVHLQSKKPDWNITHSLGKLDQALQVPIRTSFQTAGASMITGQTLIAGGAASSSSVNNINGAASAQPDVNQAGPFSGVPSNFQSPTHPMREEQMTRQDKMVRHTTTGGINFIFLFSIGYVRPVAY